MTDNNNLINRVLYLTHDKWKVKINNRTKLKEFLEIMLDLKPKSEYLLREIIEFDGLVMAVGVVNYVGKKEPALFREVSAILCTRKYLKKKNEKENKNM